MAKVEVSVTAYRLTAAGNPVHKLVSEMRLGVFDNEQLALKFIAGLPTERTCPSLRDNLKKKK